MRYRSAVFLTFFALGALTGGASGPVAERHTLTFAALGDSITSGVNARGWGVWSRVSWASGKHHDQESFRARWAELQNRPVTSQNLAKGGATSKNFLAQARQLRGDRLDLVTVFFGANDLCHGDPHHEAFLSEYVDHMTAGVRYLLEERGARQVVVLPVLNLSQLHQLKGSDPTCQRIWKITGICGALLGTSDEPLAAKLTRINTRRLEMNAALAKIVAKYPNQMMFLSDIAAASFSHEHVSTADCFHPSINGQKFLARLAWEGYIKELAIGNKRATASAAAEH